MMEKGLAIANKNTALGIAANQAASRAAFVDYQSRRAKNTITRQRADLALFAEFLTEQGLEVSGDALATDPETWRPITWGLVEAFVKWQLLKGYAVGTVNVRLSTIKTYARLATKAGTLDPTEFAMIKTVSGYSNRDGKRINEQREDAGLPTRISRKKSEPVSLTPEQAAMLKNQPDTPQGRRDRLIMCLLLDHGLRVSEVAGLTVGDIDLKAGELHFYRPKVDKMQTHRLTRDTLEAARAYMENDAPAIGPLLRQSRKDGRLHGQGMSARRISHRVRVLGEKIGVNGLSAHDCRHFWATRAARAGTPIDRLQDAGGWSSPAMPLRYVESAKVANEGVILR